MERHAHAPCGQASPDLTRIEDALDCEGLGLDDVRQILASSFVGAILLDGDLNIRFFTQDIRPMFNMLRSDVGRPLADFRPMKDDPGLMDDARRVLARSAVVDRTVAAEDGRRLLRRIVPLLLREGGIGGVIVTLTDITRHTAHVDALQTSRLVAECEALAKSRSLAAASHDLRQPLQSLVLLQGLLDQVVTDPAGTGLLRRFERTLHAMAVMLDALLSTSQIEAGTRAPRRIAFSMSCMLSDLRDDFADAAQAKGVSLRMRLGSVWRETPVFSDPSLLEQMIRNLFGNALKYTASGKILIGCRRRADHIRIEVWDTGIGIEADQLAHIFDVFYQVANPTRDVRLGLGLGLAIVRRLAGLLGCVVSARSWPGRGSVFAITVPHAPADATTPLPRQGIPAVQPDHRCKVMIVDNDPDVLSLLTQSLEAQGYLVRAAPDGASAMRLAAQEAIRPDILLTDYHLVHGMDGLHLLAGLRALLRHPLPGIVLTGDVSPQAVAALDGADHVRLSKPVDPADLIHVMEALCPPAPTDPDGLATDRGQASVVHIVAGQAHVRTSLRDVLEAYGHHVKEYSGGAMFLAAYRPGGEGCLLVDANVPGLSEPDLLEALRARHDSLPVIAMTGHDDIALGIAAMRAGAWDCLEKPAGRIDVLACVHRALNRSHETVSTDQTHAGAVASVAALTRRQKTVMAMVLAGLPSKNIAADLGISQRTVENHRAEIMLRMGVKSIPDLVRKAEEARKRKAP